MTKKIVGPAHIYDFLTVDGSLSVVSDISTNGSFLGGNVTSGTDPGHIHSVTSNNTNAGSYNLMWNSGNAQFSSSTLTMSPSTGDLTSSGVMNATNFVLSSDYNLKSNIKPINSENIDKIELKEFNLKTEPDKQRYGVIAQDLEEYYPEMVYINDQDFKQVAYIDFLIMKIDSLEKRIIKLEYK